MYLIYLTIYKYVYNHFYTYTYLLACRENIHFNNSTGNGNKEISDTDI